MKIQKLKIPPFRSGGLILSYRCTNSCRHCIYAGSPSWKEWMSEEDLKHYLTQIKKYAPNQVGLHIAGGEPFLDYGLTLRTVELCIDNKVPLHYIETNAYWCTNEKIIVSRFKELRDCGLPAMLISVSPFHNEFIPFERTKRAIRIAREIFGTYNVLLYTEYFYQQLKRYNPCTKNSFKEYLDIVGFENAATSFINYYSLIPCGRAATKLNFLYNKQPPEAFTNQTCLAEFTNPEHIHIDNYGNYIVSFCAGITLGNARDLGRLFEGIELTEKPILEILGNSGPYGLLKLAQGQFEYIISPEGYMTKCHLCQDIRAHIVRITDQFDELKTKEFYSNL